ncbi:MAG: hypothetical protein RLN62_01510 [Rickettsiales bacterium]
MDVRQIPPDGCYSRNVSSNSIMPYDARHNCELYEYDHDEHSFVSNFLVRNVVNTIACLATTIAAWQFVRSEVFNGNRDVWLYGGALSIGYVCIENSLPVLVNDIQYRFTGYDFIWGMADDFNDAIYGALYVPRLMLGLFPSEEKSVSEYKEVPVNDEQSVAGESNAAE